MKKVSVKKQLVDFMLANGNDFRYTDVIKTILRINKGRYYQYDPETDRGYFATNMCRTTRSNGYLVSGAGVCGLYKNSNGRWSAKYWSDNDKAQYKKVKEHNALQVYKWRYYGVAKDFIMFVPVN
jgi:hypothetical protein